MTDAYNFTEKDIHLISIFVFLCSDDIALFTTNPEGSQLKFNYIFQYSCQW